PPTARPSPPGPRRTPSPGRRGLRGAGRTARRAGRRPESRSCPRALDERGEVLEHAEPPPLTLLRMELGPKHVVTGESGREGDPVLAGRDRDRPVAHVGIVGVDKVEVCAARDAVEERDSSVVPDLVPAHVRHLPPAREAALDAPHHVEALGVPEFLALGEEELVAEADAEERPPAVERAAER